MKKKQIMVYSFLFQLGVLAKEDSQGQGMVVRTKCNKQGLPDPSRVYAMKVIPGVMDTSTYSTVSYLVSYVLFNSRNLYYR